MEFEQFVTEGLGDSSYLLASEGEGLIVDPQRDVDRFVAAAGRMGVRIGLLVETHVHNDYLSGALELHAATGAEIAGPAEAGYAFPHRPLHEGDELAVGALRVRAMATPGHTPEHLSYLVFADGSDHPVAVFTGGSLIVGSAGRADLLGPDRAHELVRAQYRSLRRLAGLPGEVVVLPTHGSGSFCAAGPTSAERTSTIGRELVGNPALTAPDEATFEHEQLDGLPAYPAYYREMAPINRTGPPVLGRIAVPRAVDVERFAELAGGATVVDGRPRETFASGHVPGAVNVELDDQFASYVGWVVPFGAPVLLLLPEGDSPDDVAAGAARALARIGYDRVLGYLDGGMAAWTGSGRPVGTYDTADVNDLCEALTSGAVRPGDVLDVRQVREWDAGHLAGSRHLFVGDLAERDGDGAPEPREGPWWVICASGHRASVASSLLDRAGVPVRLVVRGGVARLLRTCAGLDARTPAG